MKKVFIFAFFLLSCTHWLMDTYTRIQVENSTSVIISDLCIVSKSGQKIILVPDSIEIGKKSKIYEVEWVGEFDFMVRVGNDWKPLGVYKLKGSSVLARIRESDAKFEMVLK